MSDAYLPFLKAPVPAAADAEADADAASEQQQTPHSNREDEGPSPPMSVQTFRSGRVEPLDAPPDSPHLSGPFSSLVMMTGSRAHAPHDAYQVLSRTPVAASESSPIMFSARSVPLPPAIPGPSMLLSGARMGTSAVPPPPPPSVALPHDTLLHSSFSAQDTVPSAYDVMRDSDATPPLGSSLLSSASLPAVYNTLDRHASAAPPPPPPSLSATASYSPPVRSFSSAHAPSAYDVLGRSAGASLLLPPPPPPTLPPPPLTLLPSPGTAPLSATVAAGPLGYDVFSRLPGAPPPSPTVSVSSLPPRPQSGVSGSSQGSAYEQELVALARALQLLGTRHPPSALLSDALRRLQLQPSAADTLLANMRAVGAALGMPATATPPSGLPRVDSAVTVASLRRRACRVGPSLHICQSDRARVQHGARLVGRCSGRCPSAPRATAFRRRQARRVWSRPTTGTKSMLRLSTVL
jgi:hypothetical protein